MEKDEILNCIKTNLSRLSKEELEDIVDKIEVANSEDNLKTYEVPFTGYFKVEGNFLVKANTPEEAKEILETFDPDDTSYKNWQIDHEELVDREVGNPVLY